jgi:hypothetical protein
VFHRRHKQSEQIEHIWKSPTKSVIYPKWTFAKTDEVYWLILEKTKMQLLSERAFWSWGKPCVQASDQSLSSYKVWKKVGFAPGTLVRSMDGQCWFITGSQPLETERRLIATPDFFGVLGFNSNNAILISQDELLFHKEGIPISNV